MFASDTSNSTLIDLLAETAAFRESVEQAEKKATVVMQAEVGRMS